MFPGSHLVICCCCRMSVQTAGQKWHCPGTSSQDWLSGCQREEVREREREGWGGGSSQPGGAACPQAAWVVLVVVGWGGGGSFHTASLNWCFQSRNVSSFGTCFVFLCFQHTSRLHSRSSPCSSLWNAKTCAHVYGVGTQYGG